MRLATALVVLMSAVHSVHAQPLTTAFTYQGELTSAGQTATSPVDLRFRLYDAPIAGNQVGPELQAPGTTPTAGRFATSLDFGAGAFTGARRWLEIDVSPAGAHTFTTLAGRQEVLASPNAAFALTSTNASALNNQPASFYTNAANLSSGTIPDARLSTNIPARQSANTFTGVNTFSNAANAFTGTHTGDGGGLTGLSASAVASGTLADARLSTNIPRLNTPNSFTAPNAFQGDVLVGGSLGSQSGGVTIIAQGQPSLRIDPRGTPLSTFSPAILGGAAANSIAPGLIACAVLSGGGPTAPNFISAAPSGTLNGILIGGGVDNIISAGDGAVIVGGIGNRVSGTFGFVGGGNNNIVTHNRAAIVGGDFNTAAGDVSFVGGGRSNRTDDFAATVAGGFRNIASGQSAAIGGGEQNAAGGWSATVPGGFLNSAGGTWSFAAGHQARVRTAAEVGSGVDGDFGTFVWADAQSPDFTSTGPNQFLIRAAGGVGIGTNAPLSPLHIVDSALPAYTPAAGTVLTLQRSADDYLTIMSGESATKGVLFGTPSSNRDGGILYSNTAGLDLRAGANQTRLQVNTAGNVGIGTVGRSIDARLHVQSDNTRAVKVDRYTSDGELLAWARDDGVVGSVTVTANTVTYGAFTGVHYARLLAPTDPGMLVSMTGDNQILGHRDEGETVYGVLPTAKPNDPAVLGVYLSSLDGKDYRHDHPLAQIAAVGNGDVWVVDQGSDLAPGDYLISSGTPGLAMKLDPARFPVGHVFAKVASRVDWATVTPDAAGVKKAKVSVLFTVFTHTDPTLADPTLADRLERLERLLDQR